MTTDKIVRQNTGFIAAESKRAHEDLQKSREFRSAGNERAAKTFQTKADNRIQRVEKAAATIMDRTKKK